MKKQTGYIYQRAGWWVLRYRENLLENGQIVRKQLAKQLAEVKPEHVRLKRPPAYIEDMAEDFLRPLNRGEANPQATQTIRQFAEDLFFPMLERQVRQSTLKGYHGRWVSQLLPRCGEVRLRDLTALSAQRVDDVNRQNPKMKRSSLAHLKNLLSLILDEALRLGSADAAKANPARLVKIPRAPEGDETYSYGLLWKPCSPYCQNRLRRCAPWQHSRGCVGLSCAGCDGKITTARRSWSRAQSGKDSATNRRPSAANRRCRSSHGCRRYSWRTNSLAEIPRAGQCLPTGKGSRRT
jgi:hypothetical protein